MKKIMIFLVAVVAMNACAQVSVICNKAVSESSLSLAKVASVFSLETTKWSNGNKIIVIDNSSDTRSFFCGAIGKDPMGLKKEWMKKILTGEAKAPETVASDEDVVNKVAATSGAIGFVKSSKTTPEVKVLIELK